MAKETGFVGMDAWLYPLRQVLDQATEPVAFFFRDDDVGWESSRLYRLLDVFAELAVPIDLAVIDVSFISLKLVVPPI